MTTDAGRRTEIRASDAERDDTARTLREATDQGRLTLEELNERLTVLYEARHRHELAALVDDLPGAPATGSGVPPDDSGGSRGRPRRLEPALAVHLAIVAVMSVMLIGRWALLGSPFFWPVFPMFWLWTSVLVHALVRERTWRRLRPRQARPD